VALISLLFWVSCELTRGVEEGEWVEEVGAELGGPGVSIFSESVGGSLLVELVEAAEFRELTELELVELEKVAGLVKLGDFEKLAELAVPGELGILAELELVDLAELAESTERAVSAVAGLVKLGDFEKLAELAELAEMAELVVLAELEPVLIWSGLTCTEELISTVNMTCSSELTWAEVFVKFSLAVAGGTSATVWEVLLSLLLSDPPNISYYKRQIRLREML
jgi:hypothetical protein